jgi:hypothetical protein
VLPFVCPRPIVSVDATDPGEPDSLADDDDTKDDVRGGDIAATPGSLRQCGISSGSSLRMGPDDRYCHCEYIYKKESICETVPEHLIPPAVPLEQT